LDDRLWDDDGNEWTLHIRWADPIQTKRFLRRDAPVALTGADPGVIWLTPKERALWRDVRRHFEVPGVSGTEPGEDGLTYGAKIWRRGQERLLMLRTFC